MSKFWISKSELFNVVHIDKVLVYVDIEHNFRWSLYIFDKNECRTKQRKVIAEEGTAKYRHGGKENTCAILVRNDSSRDDRRAVMPSKLICLSVYNG